MKLRILLAVLLASNIALAQTSEAPLADSLPPEALMYVGWAGRSLAFDGSHLGQMLQDPAAKQVFASLKELALSGARENEEAAWVAPVLDLAEVAWQHPVAAVLLRPQADAEDPSPGMLVVIEAGKDRKELSARFEALLKATGMEAKGQEVQVGGASFRKFPAGKVDLFLGFVGPQMVFSVGQQPIEQMLQTKPESSLAADQSFAGRMGEVAPKAPQSAVYVDIQGFVQAANKAGQGPVFPEKLLKTMEGGMYFAYGACVEDRYIHQRARQFWRPAAGLREVFGPKPLTPEQLDWVPSDAMLACSFQVDLAKLIAYVQEVSGQAGQPLPPPVKMFTDLLGDDWTLASAPSLGGLLTGTALSVSVKDPEKVQALLSNMVPVILGQMQGPVGVRTYKVQDQQITYFLLQDEAAFWSPAFALKGNRLFLAAWPQVLESALTLRPQERLVNDPTFQNFVQRIGGMGHGILYIDMKDAHRLLYGPMMMGNSYALSLISQKGLVNEGRFLPGLSTISRWTSPSLAGFRLDQGGLFLHGYSKAGPLSTMSVPVVSGVVTAVLPSIAKARYLARLAVNRSTLKALHNALILYHDENGKLPESLAQLVEKEIIEVEMLQSPLDENGPSVGPDGKLRGEPSFIYVRPADTFDKIRNPGRTVLLFVRPGLMNDEQTQVLLADGTVEQMHLSRLQKLLAGSNTD